MEFLGTKEFLGTLEFNESLRNTLIMQGGLAGSPISPLSNVESPATICWRPAGRIPESAPQNPECTL